MGDDYESSEMHDGAPVVHRDKHVSRAMALLLGVPGLLTMVLGAFVAMTNATASRPVPAAALPLVVALVVGLGLGLAALGVVFGVLRTVVTARAVHVKYGMWGPTIPLDAIRSCEVVAYDPLEFGGWGIRLGRKGAWAYVPAAAGPVLELVYVDEATKKERRVLVGAANAEETRLQIERARARAAGSRVRVAEPSAPRARVAEGPAPHAGESPEDAAEDSGAEGEQARGGRP
mgnify:CR=1 FL=1